MVEALDCYGINSTMDDHSSKSRSTFVINRDFFSRVGKMPLSVSPIYDSGLGSLPSMEQPPPRPKLIGGAAIQEEGDDESGVFSGDRYAEADSCVAVPSQPMDTDTTIQTTAAFDNMSISNSPLRREMMTTVRTDRPQVRHPTQKTKGSGRTTKVRRPHRNFAMSARSSSPRLPDNSGNNLSGSFSNSHTLPQSWDTSGYNSGLSTVDIFSGSSAVNAPGWPAIDIFELQQNVQYFLPNRDGDTGFHLAVIHGENDLLDKLLFIMSRDNRLRTVIDEQNNLYQTALHLATHMQHTEMIRKLLIAGASLNITDHKGNTPLHIAARFSSTKSVEEIIRYMSVQTILQVATIKNNEGLTCIHIAAKQGNMDTLRKFKSLGVDVDMQDLNSGKTALHSVVEKGSLSDVQFMLETCRANINGVTYTGCTPLHIAAGRGDIALTAYLLSMGANPDLVTDEGDTALDLAGSDQVRTLLTKAAALRWLY